MNDKSSSSAQYTMTPVVQKASMSRKDASSVADQLLAFAERLTASVSKLVCSRAPMGLRVPSSMISGEVAI